MASPYPCYRSSGVHWLGLIPAHWKIDRLKFLAAARTSPVDKHIRDDEVPVRLCNYVDVYNNELINSDIDFMEATATTAEIERFKIKAGDVLITKDSKSWDDIAVPAMIEEDLDDVLCGYHLAIIRSLPDVFDPGYLFRLFSSEMLNYQFKMEANGVTRFGLPTAAIDSALLLCPPIEEQIAISQFLDHETTRIDRLIEKKRRMLELFAEKRMALITKAVLKGLDSSVKTKDSGVEWIGQIPAHWKTNIKFQYLARAERNSFVNGPFGSDLLTNELIDEGVPVLYSGDIREVGFAKRSSKYVTEEKAKQLDFCRADPGCLLLAKVGDPPGCACLYPQDEPAAIVTQDVVRVRLDTRIVDPHYIVYFQIRRLDGNIYCLFPWKRREVGFPSPI